eukprot:m.17984 g.17984  ORF g.17984 m.17984 type:complete len:88 (-) comp3296_c1_seq1:356-619(-)
MHLQDGRTWLEQFFPALAAKPWVASRFQCNDYALHAYDRCYFVFTTWDKRFNVRAGVMIRELFQRAGVHVESSFATEIFCPAKSSRR